MNNEQLIRIATEWAVNNQDFLENFVNMIEEYRAVVDGAGVDPETLTATKNCLLQVESLFLAMEV